MGFRKHAWVTSGINGRIVGESKTAARSGCQYGKHPMVAIPPRTYFRSMDENNFLPPGRSPCPRILVVDDDRSIRLLNAEVLTSRGYAVTVANDGIAAWDELQLNHHDLLITDNDMPRLTGMELVRRLYDAHLTLPVIMVTGTFPLDEIARQPELQIQALLLKPYTVNELLDAVRNVLLAGNPGQAMQAPFKRQHPSTDPKPPA
jgi:CheY-like chemotaxis protein